MSTGPQQTPRPGILGRFFAFASTSQATCTLLLVGLLLAYVRLNQCQSEIASLRSQLSAVSAENHKLRRAAGIPGNEPLWFHRYDQSVGRAVPDAKTAGRQ